MPHISIPNHDPRECLCCGDIMTPGGAHCECRVTPDWYQDHNGEVACALHRMEKFSFRSLAQIKREREMAAAQGNGVAKLVVPRG